MSFVSFLPKPLKRSPLRPQEHYNRFATRESAMARDEVWIRWMIDQGCSAFIDIGNGRTFDYYVEKASLERVLEQLLERMVRTWPRHRQDYPQRAKALMTAAAALASAAKVKDATATLKRLTVFNRAAYAYCDYIWGAWAVIFHVEPVVVARFPQQIELIAALDRPIRYVRLLRDLWRFPPETIATRYGWLKVYNPHDRAFTVNDLVRLKRETHRRELLAQFREYPQNRRAFAAFRKTIRHRRTRQLVDIVHSYAFLKTDRIDVYRRTMYTLRPFYQWLADQLPHGTISQTVNLTTAEVEAQIRAGIRVPFRERERRASGSVVYRFDRAGIGIDTDRPRVARVLRTLRKRELAGGLLRGTVACQGKARGRVCIVVHSADVRKVRPGHIFIAKYTYPQYTPAMRMCSAIVTDEGGLTSHAAVVAREYGIPCVVGMQVATRVFKDGDRVEVDATKGVVRKL